MRAWQPLPYSCLGNPVDTEVWQFMVHRVAKSQTRQATSRGQKEKKRITWGGRTLPNLRTRGRRAPM